MKKLLYLLVLSSSMCLAQENKKEVDIRRVVVSVLTQHLDKDLLGRTPRNFAYLFSITLSFNDLGRIDTAYFPKSVSRNVMEVMKLNAELVRKLKSNKDLEYKKYASKLVLIPLFYKQMTDNSLDYDSGFLNAFENILPKINDDLPKKAWVLLDPQHVSFSLSIN